MRIKWFWSLVILLLLVPAIPVSAHSPIEKRIPATDAILEVAPDKIELFFEDLVQIHRSSVTVLNEQGEEIQLGKPVLDPINRHHLTVDVQDPLVSGQYTVYVDAVSIDGHPLKENYQFQVKIKVTSDEEKFRNLKLARTSPEDGFLTQKSPLSIDLWYTEAAKMDYFALTDDKDKTVETGRPIVDSNDPKHFIVHLKDELPKGTYSIHSQVKIGEQKKYDIRYFAVDEFTPITGAAYKFGDTSIWDNIKLLQWAHWITYSSLLALAGGLFAVVRIFRQPVNQTQWRMITNMLYGISLVGLLLELFANKTQYSEITWADFINLYFARVLISQIVILFISFFIPWNKLKLALLTLVLLGFALSGHTAAPTYGGFWSMVFDMVHLLASAVWVGGVAALAALAPKDNRAEWLKENGRAFSKWAVAALIALPITGVLMTLRFVPSFTMGSMLSSYWGQMLLVKILLYLFVIAIAFWQRRKLVRWAIGMVSGFQNLMRVEAVTAALILFAAAVLVDVSPKEAEKGIYSQAVVADGIQATVEIIPLIAGPNEFTITLADPADVEKVRVKFSTTTGWAVVNNAFPLGNGIYKLTGGFLHAAGTVNMEILAYRTDGSMVTIPYKIQVPGVMPPTA